MNKAGSKSRRPSPISIEQMAPAIRRVQGMDLREKEKVIDRIFETHPRLVMVCVALKDQVPYADLDHVFHVLLVLWEAFTDGRSGVLAPVTSEMLLRAREMRMAMLKFFDAGDPAELRKNQHLACEKHAEPNALAFVVGLLNEHGLTRKSEANEMICSTCTLLLDALIEARSIALAPTDG